MLENKDSKIYIIVICFLILVSIITIVITHHNYNYENRIYSELKKNVTVLKEAKVKDENENKLVLVHGKLEYNNETLEDDFLGVSIKAPTLIRIVEIYEWVETTVTKKDGTKVSKHTKIWANEIVNSDNFHDKTYKNVKNKPIGSKFFFADSIKLGDFELTTNQKSKLPWNKRINLKQDMYLVPGYKIYGNYATNSKDPDNPKIGDIRIAYYYSDTSDLTILAVQSKNTFKDYATKENSKINIVKEGNLSFEKLMKTEKIKKSS